MTDLSVAGMVIAGNVVETIVSIAVKSVEGVASVGSPAAGGLLARFGAKQQAPAIESDVDENDKLHVAVRIEVFFGCVLPDVAAQVRRAVAEAIEEQIGIEVGSVDVYVDGIRFTD